MKEEGDQGTPFFSDLKGIILDCRPGDDDLEGAYRAARLSVPENSIISKTLLYPTMVVISGLQHARLIRAIWDLRELLNDPTIFGTDPRRQCMYSIEDAQPILEPRRHVQFELLRFHLSQLIMSALGELRTNRERI